MPVSRLLCRSCRQRQDGIALSWAALVTGPSQITRGQQYSSQPAKRIQPMAVQKPPPPRAASPAPSKIPAAPIQSHRSSARLPPPRADPPRLVLNSNDLPSLSQWEASIDSLQIDFLSAADCQQTARTYVSVATQYESDWRGTLHSSMECLTCPYIP